MADDATLSPEISLNIKGPSELKLTISISPDKTVADLKAAIASQTDVEQERQRLIYSGKVLKDEEALSVYKLQSNHTIHMVKGAPKTAPAQAAPAAAAFGAPSQAGRALPTMATGQGAGPLAALEGVQGHGFGGGTMNPFADMGNLNDPNAMGNMMNSPAFLEQMGTMLQNPEVVDQIIASNPQLAGMGPQIRQMMQSDQFRSFLTNPDALRQMMQMQQMMGGGGMGGAGGAAAPAFPPPGAFGAAAPGSPPAAGAGAAPANPFAMFGAPPGGAGGMQMPTPEQMQQMMGMTGGGAGAGGFGGLGGLGGGAARAPADARPAHERFADQLVQLQAMGFYDGQTNIEALTVCGGNVSAAVEYLFSHPPPGGN